MKILAISPVLPYPPNDGDRLRLYHFLEYLSKKHEIWLVSFIRKGEEASAGKLKKICAGTVVVPLTGAEIFQNAVKAVFTGEPLNTAAYESDKMREAVDETIARVGPDILFVYRLRMAQYAEGKKLPKVIDIVDSMALLNERRVKYEKNPFRLAYSMLDRGRILKYERELKGKFPHIFINSEDDAKYLKLSNIIVAQNGSSGRKAKAGKKGAFKVGFFGNMDYPPNLDAAMYFYRKVWKNLAASDNNIKLVIAGDRRKKLSGLASSNVEIKGYIGDIDAEISSWGASVVPVRYGAGRQNKTMKSWSCGVPVVSSSFAAAGVYGRDGVNMLVAGTPAEYAEKILALKNNGPLRKKIIAGGFKTVKKFFDWKISGGKIEAVMKKDAKKK